MSSEGINSPAPELIALVGFMGTGKSTVGRILADLLGWGFTDLDDEIEFREGRSIPDVFSSDGEKYFREREHEALRNVLERSRCVIATGGGLSHWKRNVEAVVRKGL